MTDPTADPDRREVVQTIQTVRLDRPWMVCCVLLTAVSGACLIPRLADLAVPRPPRPVEIEMAPPDAPAAPHGRACGPSCRRRHAAPGA